MHAGQGLGVSTVKSLGLGRLEAFNVLERRDASKDAVDPRMTRKATERKEF